MRPTPTETTATRAKGRDRVPELLLERLALGELDATTEASVRSRLAAEPDGEARLAEITRDNEATLARWPANQTLATIRARVNERERLAEPGGKWRRWSPMLVGAFGVAVAVLVARPWADSNTGEQTGASAYVDPYGAGATTSVKGAGDKRASLHIYRKSTASNGAQASASEMLAPGAHVATNDTLQVGYIAAGKRHGVLLSIDGRGAVTLHFPTTPTGDTSLSDKDEVALPFAYQLDDAPNFERFFFVTSSESVDVRGTMESARQLAASVDGGAQGTLVLPTGYDVTTMLLHKPGEAP